MNGYGNPYKQQIFVFNNPEIHTWKYKLSEIYCKTKLAISQPFFEIRDWESL